MTLKNYLNISIKNIIRNKKNTVKIFFITLFSFILFILTTSLAGSLNNFIDNSMLNTIDHRSIMINYSTDVNIDIEDRIKTTLENDTSIIEFHEYKEPIAGNIRNSRELFENENENIVTLVSGFEKEIPDIIKGNKFDKDDRNVAIIPKEFDPSGTNLVDFKKESTEYLDGEDFLDKTITVEFKDLEDETLSFEYSFKVIGVYDSVKNMDFASDVYIPYNDMEMVYEKYIKTMSEYDSYDYNSFKTLVALADNHETVENVVNKLRENNIDAFPKSTVGLLEHLYKIIIYLGTIISIVVLIVAIINISLNNVNLLKKRQSELGMLKAFGYKDSQLKNIIIFESTIINIVSLLLGLIMCKVFLLILNIVVKNYMSIYMSNLNFEINPISITIGVVIMISSIIFSNLKSILYIINLQPIKSIKSKY